MTTEFLLSLSTTLAILALRRSFRRIRWQTYNLAGVEFGSMREFGELCVKLVPAVTEIARINRALYPAILLSPSAKLTLMSPVSGLREPDNGRGPSSLQAMPNQYLNQTDNDRKFKAPQGYRSRAMPAPAGFCFGFEFAVGWRRWQFEVLSVKLNIESAAPFQSWDCDYQELFYRQ